MAKSPGSAAEGTAAERTRPAAHTRAPAGGARRSLWIAVIVALLTGVAGGYALRWGLQPTKTALPPVYTTNAQLTQRWIAAIRSMDVEKIARLYTKNAVWNDQAMGSHHPGHAGVRFGWSVFDMGYKPSNLRALTVDDHGAVARSTLANGSSRVTGVSVLRMSGGEITAETVYYDSADVT